MFANISICISHCFISSNSKRCRAYKYSRGVLLEILIVALIGAYHHCDKIASASLFDSFLFQKNLPTVYFVKQKRNYFRLFRLGKLKMEETDRIDLDPKEKEKVENKTENAQQDSVRFDFNKYAEIKTMAKGLLNVSLLTSNANNLKIIIKGGPENNQLYWPSIILTVLSIILQTAMAILAVFVGKNNINIESNHSRATLLNRTILILAVLTIIVNILITSFS